MSTPGPKRVITLQIDLEAPRVALHRSLQRTIDLVSFGMTAVLQAKGETLTLPGAFFQMTTAGEARMDFETARGEFSPWILGNGFRDVVEAISEFLEETRVAYAGVTMAGRAMPAADFHESVARDGRVGEAFRKLSFPDKLASLERDYGLRPTLRDSMLSIQRARNCLVHRLGVVAGTDKNDEAGLRVTWRRAELLIQDEKGERPATPGEVTVGQAQILLRVSDATKIFAIGDRVRVSEQEFAEICFGVSAFAEEVRGALHRHAKDRGLLEEA